MMCEKRTERLCIRCTKEEKKKLDKIKAETGKSISDILLGSALDPKEVSEREYLSFLKLQTKYIKIINEGYDIPKHIKAQTQIKLCLLEEMLNDLQEVR